MKPSRRVFGVDPGLARLGWAVLETRGQQLVLIDSGCLETTGQEKTERRLRTLFVDLLALLKRYSPFVMSVEKLYFTNNISTGMAVSQARGIALLAAAMTDVPVVEFTPTSVKQAVTGDGRADKRQIQRMVALLLRLKRLPRHDDTTDAMALAICGSAVSLSRL